MYGNLIFDIDGTIWNSTAVVALAWIKAAKELGLPYEQISADRLKKEFGKPMTEIFESLFPEADKAIHAKMQELLYVYEHEFLEETKEDLAYPHMRETMAKLSESHKLYIVSNCQKGYIELVMKKNGIGDYITDFLCFGDTLKPKNYTIEEIIRRNKLDKADCCYIGDIQGDLNATRAAGIDFVHAAWGFGQVEDPDLICEEYIDLLEL